MRGIKKTRTGWLIDVDTYTKRDRYYTGDRFGIVIRTTKDPMLPFNSYYTTEADFLIGMLNDYNELVGYAKVYRRGKIIK